MRIIKRWRNARWVQTISILIWISTAISVWEKKADCPKLIINYYFNRNYSVEQKMWKQLNHEQVKYVSFERWWCGFQLLRLIRVWFHFSGMNSMYSSSCWFKLLYGIPICQLEYDEGNFLATKNSINPPKVTTI